LYAIKRMLILFKFVFLIYNYFDNERRGKRCGEGRKKEERGGEREGIPVVVTLRASDEEPTPAALTARTRVR
jgi:hypothetical protein